VKSGDKGVALHKGIWEGELVFTSFRRREARLGTKGGICSQCSNLKKAKVVKRKTPREALEVSSVRTCWFDKLGEVKPKVGGGFISQKRGGVVRDFKMERGGGGYETPKLQKKIECWVAGNWRSTRGEKYPMKPAGFGNFEKNSPAVLEGERGMGLERTIDFSSPNPVVRGKGGSLQKRRKMIVGALLSRRAIR